IEKLGLRREFLKNILIGVGGFILLVLIAIILNLLLMSFGFSDSNKVYEKVKDLPLYVLPFAFIVAPLSEELFFRGYLVKKYGILISALIFSLVHISYGSIVEILFAFAFGVIAGYLYKKRESLLVPIVMHFLFNLIFVIVFLARIYLENRDLV
ncbi:CPBP family intramembrane metalloprotease, partial [Candidatus Micrarchaeota archaeon]|nr:CPBP family intramembrane metalloprotease [Candidatus Micrarchaeota archaeon]